MMKTRLYDGLGLGSNFAAQLATAQPLSQFCDNYLDVGAHNGFFPYVNNLRSKTLLQYSTCKDKYRWLSVHMGRTCQNFFLRICGKKKIIILQYSTLTPF